MKIVGSWSRTETEQRNKTTKKSVIKKTLGRKFMYTLNLFGLFSLDAIKIKCIYLFLPIPFLSLVVCLCVYLLSLRKGFSNYSINKLLRIPKQHIKGQPVVVQKFQI